jgi:hypothetical protein
MTEAGPAPFNPAIPPHRRFIYRLHEFMFSKVFVIATKRIMHWTREVSELTLYRLTAGEFLLAFEVQNSNKIIRFFRACVRHALRSR